jgi:hypothetical protein
MFLNFSKDVCKLEYDPLRFIPAIVMYCELIEPRFGDDLILEYIELLRYPFNFDHLRFAPDYMVTGIE